MTRDDMQLRTARASATTPIVFVVDADASVRESVELLIETWPETFASAEP